MNLRNNLIACFQDTLAQIQEDSALQAATQKSMRDTSFYTERPKLLKKVRKSAGTWELKAQRTLEVAKDVAPYGKVAILNFASPVQAGGGVVIGADTQEESLCRSTNLYACLNQQINWDRYYMPNRIKENDISFPTLLYTKNVTVIKTDEILPQRLKKNEYYQVDVLTCAAPNLNDNNSFLPEDLSKIFEDKIRLILEVAINNAVQYLVLGALGCGAFKNPPEIVAHAFYKLLIKEDYIDYFEKVIFAIPNQHSTNYRVFQMVFQQADAAPSIATENMQNIENQEQIICAQCGRKLSKDDQFCCYCGAPLPKSLQLPNVVDVEPKTPLNPKEELEKSECVEEILQETVEENVPVHCAFCGAKLSKNDKFCYKCGKPMQPASNLRTCPVCHAQNVENSAYCYRCGQPLLQKAQKNQQDLPAELKEVLIGGRYKLILQTGKGGCSVVYMAQDIKLNRVCAIKIIKKDSPGGAIAITDSLNEANKLKMLAHVAIPQLYDIIEDDEKLCIVMEFVEGTALNTVIRNRKRPMPQEDIVDIAKQICNVLFYLHTLRPARIFRDLKPANIILQSNGLIKLIDFGIMKVYDESITEDTANLGTLGYAAPEQFGGKGQTDARTDIYCLGMTLYHLITGICPAKTSFEMRPIREYRYDVSDALIAIVKKCTAVEREDRYQSAMEVYMDLEKI